MGRNLMISRRRAEDIIGKLNAESNAILVEPDMKQRLVELPANC
jgi:hypothetical protein